MHYGVIYVARCQEFYKIGYTQSDPVKRLSSLQTGSPYRIELLGTTSGSQEDEQRLHEFFAPKRERGEWFRLTSDDVQSILASQLPSALSARHERELKFAQVEGFLDKMKDLPPEQLAEFLGELRKIGAPV